MSTQQIDLDPLLEDEARNWVRAGWRVESRLPGQISIVGGKPVNHVLHLLLSIITLGLWLLVWLIIGISGGERRKIIDIGHDGRVRVRKA